MHSMVSGDIMLNTIGAWFVGITIVLIMIAILRAISGV